MKRVFPLIAVLMLLTGCGARKMTANKCVTYATKGGTPARLGYYDNYLVDNNSCVIVGVQATAARMSQETVAAQQMLTRFGQR